MQLSRDRSKCQYCAEQYLLSALKIDSLICPPIFLNFSIYRYTRAAILPDRVLASVKIFCLGNIRNRGNSNSLLFFVVILNVCCVIHRNLKKNRRKNGKHLYQRQGTQRPMDSMI